MKRERETSIKIIKRRELSVIIVGGNRAKWGLGSQWPIPPIGIACSTPGGTADSLVIRDL